MSPRNVSSGRSDTSHRFDCRICKGHHPLSRCRRFRSFNKEKKIRMVALHRYCSNCFAHSHLTKNCDSKFRCAFCDKDHHSLLHLDDDSTLSLQPDQRSAPNVATKSITDAYLSIHPTVTLIPTAMVRVKYENSSRLIRALIDPCSERSLIAEPVVKRLNLPTIAFGDLKLCSIIIQPYSNDKFSLRINAKVTQVQYSTPAQDVDSGIAQAFENIMLADTKFYERSSCGLVLGGDVYCKLIKPGILPQGHNSLLTAQNSVLGYFISGSVPF